MNPTPAHQAAIANLLVGMAPEPAPDPVLVLLRELQCRLDDLAVQVAYLIERSDADAR